MHSSPHGARDPEHKSLPLFSMGVDFKATERVDPKMGRLFTQTFFVKPGITQNLLIIARTHLGIADHVTRFINQLELLKCHHVWQEELSSSSSPRIITKMKTVVARVTA